MSVRVPGCQNAQCQNVLLCKFHPVNSNRSAWLMAPSSKQLATTVLLTPAITFKMTQPMVQFLKGTIQTIPVYHGGGDGGGHWIGSLLYRNCM